MKITIKTASGAEEFLESNGEGIFQVPLRWRYILPGKEVLDPLLEAQGAERMDGPDGIKLRRQWKYDYEPWKVR